jgi:hypothetical protein
MRFMMMIKADKNTEAGVLPDEKILAAMGEYNNELVKAGALLGAEGLQPTSKGFRITNSGGKITVTDGPFTEAKEIVAGYWIIQAKSKQEAIEWAKRVPFEAGESPATAGGVGQIEIRQLFEVDDFPVNENESGWREEEEAFRAQNQGLAPVEIPGTLRYLMTFMADERSEAGVLPDEKVLSEMGGLMGEMADKGVLLAGEGLQPSSKGARVYFSNGKRTVTDGPFAEAKELIGGFCMIRVNSKEEAVEWARRGIAIHGDGECEVRQVFQASDFPAELMEKVPEVFEAEREFRERASQ